MKKLCLILTVLYAIWANCSAQSLNIAQNLLEDNSSTFESGMGSWTCNDNNACSRASESGRNGNYLKLTNTGAGNDYDKQMEYKLNGNPPAIGKKYVIKFWAKRNGNSGKGKIKVLLQKNDENEKWPQQEFSNNPFTVSNDWTHYEFDITANRGDYQVIKINFGDCGEVWIDDIEYGEYSANVAPVHATGVTLDKTSASVKQGKTITLTATVEPADAVNKNVTWSSNNASVATVNKGVVTGVATGSAKITVTTEDGSHTASCTVTVTTSLPPVLIADFNDIASLDGTISPHYASHVVKPSKSDNMYIDLIADPYNDGKCVAVSDGNHKDQEYCTINLPNTVNIKDYGILAFDICYPPKSTDAGGHQHESMNYKLIPIFLIYTDRNGDTKTVKLAQFNTPVFPAPVWDTKMIGLKPLAGIDFEGASNFQIKIGPINSNRCIYYLDNIRIKENVDDVENFKQDDDLSDIWWKYADETLYIKGTGPIPAYTGSKKCPWKDLGDDRTPYIKHVIVSEGITGIGDYSVGNSQKDNVDITLHSIPEYFGENCLKRQNAEGLTRTLHLQLWDKEKPFIAKSKSTYFPAFNTAKYYRNVTNTYSTVCLPFPVAEETVTDAGAELFDFTSIKKNGEQYTLAFSKHSGDMVAGQTYLVKNHNINGTLQNTDVTKEQFNLTPSASTKTVENSAPSFSISMTGVFQPSVFGPNLGTKDAPVYAYGFLNEKFYMNGGNMSVRPMRGYFKGSQLYSAPGYGEQQQPSGAKQMPKMFNFEIVPDIVTHISTPAFIAEDFNIEEVYSPSGMKTESLNKGLNIIRTSTGRVLKVMVK